MNAFEELMSRRWIVKARDKEKYYRIKDQAASIRKFVNEKLGFRLISNACLIKLEKIPGEAKPWMGIKEFVDREDYAFLCLVLMFLEDKESEEQFVLSQLTEYIRGNYPDGGVDWTIFQQRRRLVRVIQFCLNNDLFLVNDGSEDSFTVDMEAEALYENTGASKYFVRGFSRDISQYRSTSDFFQSDWVDMDEERGVVRRQRVYRKLLLAPFVYREGAQDEDFAYIKNYRNLVEGDLKAYLDVNLHVHKTSAYLIVGENSNLGQEYPDGGNLSEMILLFHGYLQNRVQDGSLELRQDETCLVNALILKEWIVEAMGLYSSGFAKKYREMGSDSLAELVMEQMEWLDFIRRDAVTNDILLLPVIGKIAGAYPKDYKTEEEKDVK